MKIWDRVSLAWSALLYGDETEQEKRAVAEVAGDMGSRWSMAAAQNPELAADVIRLSGLLTTDPLQIDAETGIVAPRDPYREFEQKGARELALKLLAAMHLTHEEINQLMETSE